jgi:hypothetical protein
MKRSLVYAMAAVVAAVLVALPAAYAADPPAKGEKPQGPPPKPLVLRFHYIPAGSFVDTLARLGRGNRLGEGLAKIPMAVNEPANAVVIIAPPEVADFLATIAKGLDQPNEFRATREEQGRKEAGFRLKMEEARRKLPPPAAPPAGPMGSMRGMMPGMGGGMMGGMMCPCPMCQRMRPGGMMGPEMGRMRERMEQGEHERMGGREGMRGRMERGEQGEQAGPSERPGAMMGRMGPGAPGGAVGPMMRMRRISTILGPEGRKAIGLSDGQADKIKNILSEMSSNMQREMQRMRAAAEKAPEAERPAKMREMMEKMAPEHAKRMEAMHDAVWKVLSAEQRVKAEKWLKEQAPMGPPAAAPKKPEVAPHGPPMIHPSDESLEPAPARFLLVAEETAAPPAEAPKAEAPKAPNPERRQRAEAARATQLFRLLDDPKVRTPLGLTPDQEKTVVGLEERAKQLHEQVRSQVREKLKGAESKATTKEEKQALRQPRRQAMQDAMAAAKPQMDAIIKEANDALTEPQRTKLQEIARDRIRAEWATGGLATLLTKKTQDELGLSAEAAGKVKTVLDELQADVKKLEKSEAMRAKYHDLVQKARAKVMELLTPEQREKLEKLLNERGGPGEPRSHRGQPPAEPGAKGYGSAT